MLDVHSPHEKMHGFKDFLLHLLTITIGLLIALGLEGYAEHWKQRALKKMPLANCRSLLGKSDFGATWLLKNS
jgi:hypothetical protein